MNKRQKESFRKVWKTLKTAFKWLLIIAIVFLLLALLNDLLHHITFLAEKVSQQGQDIDNLRGQLHDLTQANTQLSSQLQLEHDHVQQLQQQLNIKINGQPISVPEAHTAPSTSLSIPSVPTVPIIVVGALTLLRSIVTAIPAF